MLVSHAALNLKNDFPRSLAILGSTGSVGTSALNVVRQNPAHFHVHALVAGRQVKKLAEQVIEFNPKRVVLSGEPERKALLELLPQQYHSRVECGEQAIAQVAAESEVSMVLAAMVGVVGLKPVIAALKAGKRVALANKETLVAAGKLVSELVLKHGGSIIPVDSEHSAIFQLLSSTLLGQAQEEQISHITLTASGGPFLHAPIESLEAVTPEQAVKHPRWSMGPKISVDSATMANKALEVIEARWLFNLPSQKIEVVIHPQSIIHSFVGYCDGTSLAQLSVPDMCAPIAYALGFPAKRFAHVIPHLNYAEVGKLEFFELNDKRFPMVSLARDCLNAASAACAAFNLANEIGVERFLKGQLKFSQIHPFVERVVGQFAQRSYAGLEDLLAIQDEVRQFCLNR